MQGFADMSLIGTQERIGGGFVRVITKICYELTVAPLLVQALLVCPLAKAETSPLALSTSVKLSMTPLLWVTGKQPTPNDKGNVAEKTTRSAKHEKCREVILSMTTPSETFAGAGRCSVFGCNLEQCQREGEILVIGRRGAEEYQDFRDLDFRWRYSVPDSLYIVRCVMRLCCFFRLFSGSYSKHSNSCTGARKKEQGSLS